MCRIIKLTSLLLLVGAVFLCNNAFAQTKKDRKKTGSRAAELRRMHVRDSLLLTLNSSDTTINSLLQRIEQYTTTFNQINNSLSEGLDTTDITAQLPLVAKRINKIDSVLNSRSQSGTLHYLSVIRDILDQTQGNLEGWQSTLGNISEKLIHNQSDLVKFTKDTLLKRIPYDSVVRKTFFLNRKAVRLLWRKADSINRADLIKISLLQDKITVAYTKVLDESDHIDSKIKKFAMSALSGESAYIWKESIDYKGSIAAWKRTVRLNTLLFNYFINSKKLVHVIGVLFFVLVFSLIIFLRAKAASQSENQQSIYRHANLISQKPLVSSLLLSTAIIPYFYAHPPALFSEMFFMAAIIFTLILVGKGFSRAIANFLHVLFCLTIVYSISNLFTQISSADRFAVLILSIASIIAAWLSLKSIKRSAEHQLPYSRLILRVFIIMQILSLLLNISGRFSLAKIAGVTAVFNLWMLVILFFVIRVIIQGLFLQFHTRKEGGNSIVNWMDYNVVRKNVRRALITLGTLLWLFFLLQNLGISDWATDIASDILSQSGSVGNASFTFGGFVIFILVIWLSSILSKIISYFYDVSAQRANDLSVLKKKNRTSTLLIRLGVLSAGFLLAVGASDFPLDKLTIIISAFGIGIGFGLQTVVNNLVSGLILAFEKPIQIGDFVEVNSRAGTMKEIGIRSSKILTEDGSEVIIPNGDLVSQQVINWTLSNNNRRMELMVGVAYGSDIMKVQTVLNKVLTENTEIMQTPAPVAMLDNFNESSIDFRVLFWVPDNSKRVIMKNNMISQVYAAFTREGIEIPFPQRDLHVFLPGDVKEKKMGTDKNISRGTGGAKKSPPGQAR
jgi:small-conductance mechanosensitive channel